MVRFAAAFPDEQIVSALRRQLTWTHFTTLVYIDYLLEGGFQGLGDEFFVEAAGKGRHCSHCGRTSSGPLAR